MKRPPGLWVLLSAGVLLLSLQEVYGIRATSLIFGKSSTTTTSTTETASEESSSANENVSEISTDVSNTTKTPLTGNPQVDYILDPNLPQELNGYNLTEYPFYERVPEDINFKCDGLHDGFYASVPHKCQVYHHCLFGTRYDFLCANYTAFDQKTFICHFVSEVDCVNSKKYWHRNDALYEAASTTTIKPVIVYTPPSQISSVLAPSSNPDGAAGAAQPAAPPRRPIGGGGGRGGRPRPPRRRRPYDYYDYDEEYEDDFYEDRPRRWKRPRPRPRPIYDDEYEEYEDERYERRGSSRRRPERRRTNKDRRKQHDHEDEKLEEDEEEISEKRTVGERRYHKRRPAASDEDEDRRRSKPKASNNRRPIEDDYEEEEKEKEPEPVVDKPIIKATSGSSIYDRPRTAPKIKPPVPKSEASKYAYKSSSQKPLPEDEEEYDDDYEEAPSKERRKSSERHSGRREEERETSSRKSSNSGRLRSQSSSKEETYEEEPRKATSERPKYTSHHRNRGHSRNSTPKPAPIIEDEEYYDDYEEEKKEVKSPKLAEKREKSSSISTSTTTSTTTTTTTTTTPKPPSTTTQKEQLRPDSIVRIVKRPFLPSRGGNPYSSRGLQPVGVKALEKKAESEEFLPLSESNVESMEVKPLFKPSPVMIKVPIRSKQQIDSEDDAFKPVSNRPQTQPRSNFKANNKDYSGPRTTQKPKIAETDPLDIDEYDVTLNDALNPTLPNLPVRGFPTGFSGSDFAYSAYQRPRYVETAAAPTSDYQAKGTRVRFEPIASYSSPPEHFVNSNADYKGQYSNFRPSRVTQAFYSTY